MECSNTAAIAAFTARAQSDRNTLEFNLFNFLNLTSLIGVRCSIQFDLRTRINDF